MGSLAKRLAQVIAAAVRLPPRAAKTVAAEA